jgi:hypothetical protein
MQSKQDNVKPFKKFNNSSMPESNQMYQVSYQVPYGNQEWRVQSFSTLQEAQSMVEFYISCGSPAKLINSSYQ